VADEPEPGKEPPRGGDPPYGPFRLEVPPPSPNGHTRWPAVTRTRRALRGVPVGVLVTGALATSVVSRVSLLNLAFFNPWQRPVVVSGVGGIAAGAARRGRLWTAAVAGAGAAVLALWFVYGLTRAQHQVLWVERNALRVVAADLARLAAYAAPAGALGAVAGRSLRVVVAAWNARRTRPITNLPGFKP